MPSPTLPNINTIETQLKKRVAYPYIWGKKQEDSWDKQSDFIYQIIDFEELVGYARKIFYDNAKSEALFNYTLNRWFNFWSAKGVEQIFTQTNIAVAEPNTRHKSIDFYLQGIPFDHKTTVFPKNSPISPQQAYANPEELLYWLYQNQSQQQRQHFANRLFIVLYRKNQAEHWQLKAELSWLKILIQNYVHNFQPTQLKTLHFEGNTALSDIIWAIQ